MNPKEKANDLVNQFKMILMDEDTECGNEILCTLIAVKNAKIAVQEILGFMDEFNLDLEMYSQFVWWENVKIELDAI
jgi:hypothetical protein